MNLRRLGFLALVLFMTGCGTSTPSEGPRYRYHIVMPDSLAGLREELTRLYGRWGAGAHAHFSISDSSSDPLYINDSLSYQQILFRADMDSVWFGSHAMLRSHALLALRGPHSVRMVMTSGIRPWLVFRALDDVCGELGGAEMAFVLYERHQPVVRMRFDGGRWETIENVLEERREFNAQTALMQSFFDFKGGTVAYDTMAVTAMVRRFPQEAVTRFRPTIHVYPDFETKARIRESVMEYSFDLRERAIHMVRDTLAVVRFHEVLSEYYARQVYGEKFPWLTLGLAIRNAGSWYGKPMTWWAGMQSLLELCEVRDLLGPRMDTQNAFLMGYLAALFWEGRPEDPVSVLRRVESDGLRFRLPAVDTSLRHRPRTPPPVFEGVCYAHTNGARSGYMSRQSATSLDELQRMGVNAISVTPFGYSRTDTSTQIGFVLDEMWDETVSSLFKVAGDAHQRGMLVMMKPHLWLGNGRWCGEIRVPDDGLHQWELAYSRFITYHALIAQLTGMSSVCVGVELPNLTTQTDMWRRIIRRARVAYDGHLTFGGNWNLEYEQILFWDDLDFIGVQQYYPLADRPDIAEDQVKGRVRELADRFTALGEKWNRPVVFTEIGFPSIQNALMSPHLEDFEQPVSEEVQAVGYRLWIEEMESRRFFNGFFWWKYESDENSRRRSSKSFSFKNKQAERIVKGHYTR